MLDLLRSLAELTTRDLLLSGLGIAAAVSFGLLVWLLILVLGLALEQRPRGYRGRS